VAWSWRSLDAALVACSLAALARHNGACRGPAPPGDLGIGLMALYRPPKGPAAVRFGPMRPGASSTVDGRIAAHKPAGPPAYRAGETFRDWPEGPELLVVPQGIFMMGSPVSEPGRSEHEGPVHKVTIGYPLAVGGYLVTRGEWRRYADETGDRAPSGGDWLKSLLFWDDRHPVVCMTWREAQDYLTWLNGKSGQHCRLLTEAEHEYMVRRESPRANSLAA
jgi:formylglycine-generating enzyme required for sulfatase activity